MAVITGESTSIREVTMIAARRGGERGGEGGGEDGPGGGGGGSRGDGFRTAWKEAPPDEAMEGTLMPADYPGAVAFLPRCAGASWSRPGQARWQLRLNGYIEVPLDYRSLKLRAT